MQAEKRFLLIRVSIYLAGFLIVAWVIGLNIWEIKQKTAPLIKVSDNEYIVYTERNYDQAELTLEFENEIPKNLQVEISKDSSAFLSNREKGIYTEEELREKLFKDNPTRYSNGSFVIFKRKIYFIDDGILRQLPYTKILKFFNLNKNSLPTIAKEEFEKMPQGELLTYESIQKDFPSKIIIKKNEEFFLTGTNEYYPIYISDIEEILKRSNYNSIKLIPGKSTQIRCFKNEDSKSKISCEFSFKKEISYSENIYRIKIVDNQNSINMSDSSIKLFGNPSLLEIITEIGKLFIKK